MATLLLDSLGQPKGLEGVDSEMRHLPTKMRRCAILLQLHLLPAYQRNIFQHQWQLFLQNKHSSAEFAAAAAAATTTTTTTTTTTCTTNTTTTTTNNNNVT
jgi:hypothetical protein